MASETDGERWISKGGRGRVDGSWLLGMVEVSEGIGRWDEEGVSTKMSGLAGDRLGTNSEVGKGMGEDKSSLAIND